GAVAVVDEVRALYAVKGDAGHHNIAGHLHWGVAVGVCAVAELTFGVATPGVGVAVRPQRHRVKATAAECGEGDSGGGLQLHWGVGVEIGSASCRELVYPR